MREIGFGNLENIRSSSTIFSNNIGIKLRTQGTSCETLGSETLRNMRSSAIYSYNIGIKLKTQKTACDKHV